VARRGDRRRRAGAGGGELRGDLTPEANPFHAKT
jgi:hypothetical protein